MERSRRPMARRIRAPWPGLVLGLLALAALSASGSGPVSAAEKLVDLETKKLQRTDKFGFAWDPQPDGTLRDGSNDCFDFGLALKVNDKSFSPNVSTKMTPDAKEIVLTGKIGTIEVTRRVLIDEAHGAARYVEVFRNKGSGVQSAKVEITSPLGGKAHATVSNLGTKMAGGMFEQGEIGIVAQQKGGSRPSVLFALSSADSPLDPTIEIKDNRLYAFTWNLKVPPGKQVALLHTVAQRRYKKLPAGPELQAEFNPFLTSKWSAGLPKAVHSVLLNFRGGEAGPAAITSRSPAHGEIIALTQVYKVKRSSSAVLFVERGKPLHGSVLGEEAHVDTQQGTVKLPLSEVAVIRGGAGIGRSMSLYLRNGEVLVGKVEAPDLTFLSKAGLKLPLEAAGIDALFLPQEDDLDGRAPQGTEFFLTQLDGSKLAVRSSGETVLDVATPWGELKVPLDDVVRVRYTRQPRPGLWMLLTDGSRFPAAILGGPLEADTLRFGAMQVEPGAIAAWNRHGASSPPMAKYGKLSGPPHTHAYLGGNAYLVGRITLEQLTLRAAGGDSPIRPSALRYLERAGGSDGELGIYVWMMRTDENVRGALLERIVPLQTPRGLCHVPIRHLRGYRVSDEDIEQEPKEDEQADEPGPDGDADPKESEDDSNGGGERKNGDGKDDDGRDGD